jgi:hypothetical protein
MGIIPPPINTPDASIVIDLPPHIEDLYTTEEGALLYSNWQNFPRERVQRRTPYLMNQPPHPPVYIPTPRYMSETFNFNPTQSVSMMPLPTPPSQSSMNRGINRFNPIGAGQSQIPTMSGYVADTFNINPPQSDSTIPMNRGGQNIPMMSSYIAPPTAPPPPQISTTTTTSVKELTPKKTKVGRKDSTPTKLSQEVYRVVSTDSDCNSLSSTIENPLLLKMCRAVEDVRSDQ